MKMFAKKAKAPAPAPPPATATPAPPPIPEGPKTDSALKLDLPDVFAYEENETKAKPTSRRRLDENDSAATTRGTVLLVESDEEVCRLISRLLQHEGFAVTKASCLAEARPAIDEVRADFLLARRKSVPQNLQTEHLLRELSAKLYVRVVDDFSELMLGQVVDYESMAQCTLGLSDLLMSLLEGANVGARGHAHSVAKYCRLVGQRLGISRRELDAVTLAGQIHDLGSLETRRQIGDALFSHCESLPATVRATLDMLANIHFPYEINELINAAADLNSNATDHFPKNAHILRVADAYDSLRRAQSGTQQTEEQIFEELRRQAAGTFDSQVLETFISMRKSEQLISAMNIFWAAVLIVDPHPEEQQLLKLRLENDDFHVETAKSLEDALQHLRQKHFTLVVTERRLDGSGDGFELLRTLRADPELRQVPVVFHAPAETDLVKYALELGAEDWLAKPHNVEIMAMKIQRIVARRHSSAEAGSDGVRGSLREMGIIEMVQILNAGSRSVQITMENGKHTGELVLQHGQIIAATKGDLQGEPAAIDLLHWDDGQFRILPVRQAPVVNVRASTDNLLLQSCYIKDRKQSPEARGLQL
jgi:DNA-binding response OmpR family regulator